MQHKKKIQKLSITNKVNSNFVNSFLYHSIGKLFCSESLNLGINHHKAFPVQLQVHQWRYGNQTVYNFCLLHLNVSLQMPFRDNPNQCV